jgi:hypothetical protein
MPSSSRYAEQPVDATSRRSVQIQANGETLIAEDDRQIVVDYVYHHGSFWRAVVPLDGVDRICGQAFNFSQPKTRRGKEGREIVFNKHGSPRRTNPILNHLQSRFTLKPDHPVELYPLHTKAFSAPEHRIYDLVYSVEAIGPVGILFNLRDGLAGSLLSAHRFVSTQEIVFERIVVENQHVVESPPLPLSDDEKRSLLVESLLRSHRAGMTERYFLYRMCGTNNCTSNPFQIVDQVVNYRWPQRLGSSLYRLPLNPRFYLRVRGLDSDPSYRKLLREEFSDYIHDAATQKRKREYVSQQIRLRRAARDSDSDA